MVGRYLAPVINEVTPRGGPNTGGTLVSLGGRSFATPLGADNAVCRFGARLSPALMSGPRDLSCFAPSSFNGPVVVSLSLNKVDFHDFAIKYTYYEQAIITGPCVRDACMRVRACVRVRARVRVRACTHTSGYEPGLEPPGGPIDGGTRVVVRGMNFVDNMGNGSSSKAGLVVRFAGIIIH